MSEITEVNVVVAVDAAALGPDLLADATAQALRERWTASEFTVDDTPVRLFRTKGSEAEVRARVESLSRSITGDFDPDNLNLASQAGEIDGEMLFLLPDRRAFAALTSAAPALATILETVVAVFGGPRQQALKPSTVESGSSSQEGAGGAKAKVQDSDQKLTTPSREPELKDLHPMMWETVEDKAELARTYFDAVIDGSVRGNTMVAWHMAKSMKLFDSACEEDKRLARDILRTSVGVEDTKSRLYQEAVTTEVRRNELLEVTVGAASALKDQVQGWKVLRNWALGLMCLGIAFSMSMTVWLLDGRDLSAIEGYLLPILIFIFAIMAVSPAVLLLLGRPLAGVDQFMPGGKAEQSGGETDESEAKGNEKKEETSKNEVVAKRVSSLNAE